MVNRLFFLSGVAVSFFSTAVFGAVSIEPGAAATVDAHGTCRQIENNGSSGIMVPTNSALEWSSGTNSFLSNVAGMDQVSVSACIVALKYNPGYSHTFESVTYDNGFGHVEGSYNAKIGGALNGTPTPVEISEAHQNAFMESVFDGNVAALPDSPFIKATAGHAVWGDIFLSDYYCETLASAPGVYYMSRARSGTSLYIGQIFECVPA